LYQARRFRIIGDLMVDRRAIPIRSALGWVALVALLAGIAAPAARATAGLLPPKLVEFLKAHGSAIGTIETIRETRSLRFEGRVRAYGLSGRTETLVAGPNDIVQSLELGPISQTTGLSGGRDAWSIDANGKVRALEGDERLALVTEAWFSSLAYVGAGDSASTGGLALGAARAWISLTDSLPWIDAGSTGTVSVTPHGGRRRQLVLDSQSHRLLRAIEVQDTDTLTAYYEDYRTVDGLTLPFRMRQTTGDSTYDVVIELDRIERNAPIDPARFQRPADDARDVRFASADSSGGRAETIPITMFGAHVFTSVRVNGRGPFSMFLDTGAGASCIDEGLARELGLAREGAIEAKGVTGTTTVSTVRVDSLGVGPITLLSQRLVALPLAGLPGSEDGRYSGILGYDFFSRFVVRIDYTKKTLSLYDPRTYEPPAGATVLPISLEGNVPSVAGTVDGRLEGQFRIDTGSGSTLDLHGPFVAENHLIASARRVAHRPLAGIGGVSLGAVARLDSFALGPFVVRDPIVGLSESSEGAFATKRSAGNIGGGILRRFTITFDYEHARIGLEPNDRLGERETFDRSGIACWTERGVRRAVHVEEDSPAWRAGLRTGDRIVSVNGRASADWDDLELARALQAEPGTLVGVRYERDGAARSARFRLEEVL